MSLRLRLLTLGLRLVTKRKLARVTDPAELRAELDWFVRVALSPAQGSTAAPLALGRGRAVAIRCGAVTPGVAILHFHGGIYLAGSPETHVPMLSRLSRSARAEVVAPAYRLAPEHPFPSALEDAEAAWEGLIERGHAPGSILLSGDSAGAGLAFALLSRLCAKGIVPAGAMAFSPWFDLTGSAPSVRANAAADPMLVAARLPEAAQYYLQGHPAEDPAASPLFADFPGCPPVFLQVSETEILTDDALRMEEKLRKAGAEAMVQLWPDVPHAWQMFAGLIPEAAEALRDAGAFARRCLSVPPQRSAGN